MNIRPATIDDLPAITALFNALIPSTTVAWRDHLAGSEEMATWFADRRNLDDPVLVATADDVVVGYTCWTAFRGGPRFPGYRHTVEHTIHVAHGQHGRGIGRQLLQALTDIARAHDVHVMVAGIDADNVASIEFHSALGFVEVARMPQVGWKFGRWLDLVLMQRIVV